MVSLPDEVRHALAELLRLLGPTFTLETLLARLSLWRNNQPLRIETDRMPVGLTGYIISLQDCDLICTRSGLDPVRRLSVTLHEVAHLLLGHVALHQGQRSVATYAEFIRAHDLTHAACRGDRQHRNDRREQLAEALATMLMEIITDGEMLFARDLFGPESGTRV
ncbi:MAG: hypothetical protein NVS2B7_30640 [Herpetosiphon sp.]